MISFKCDVCGKELGRWYRVTVSPYALCSFQNVSHMIKNECMKDICEDCFEKVKRKWGELINERPTEHSKSESHRTIQQKASACGQSEP